MAPSESLSDGKRAASVVNVHHGCHMWRTRLQLVDELIGKWKHKPKEKAPELAKDTDAWGMLETAAIKSRITLDMNTLVQKGHPHDDLKIFAKPKGVQTTKVFQKGQLQLVPITNRVEIESEDTEKSMAPRALRIDAQTSDGHLDLLNQNV